MDVATAAPLAAAPAAAAPAPSSVRSTVFYKGLLDLEEAIPVNEAEGWVLQGAGRDASRHGQYWARYRWTRTGEPPPLR